MTVLQLCAAAGSGSGIANYARSVRGGLRSQGVEVIPFPVSGESQFRRSDVAAYVTAALSRADEGIDVVHGELGGDSVHEFHASCAIARRAKIPICVTLHDPPRAVWSAFEFKAARKRALGRAVARQLGSRRGHALELELLHAASAVFVLAPKGRTAVQQTFPTVASSKLVVLPYPIPHRTPPGPNRCAEGLLVGFFGHWYGGKGLELLVRSVAQLGQERPPVRLRVWGGRLRGDAAPTYERRVRRALRDLGDPSTIELRGWLDDERVAEELGACDVIVLPYEQPRRSPGLASVSAALFDAFSVGVPAIVTDVRALPDFVEDGVNGFVIRPGDSAALVAALRRLRDRPDLRELLARGARYSAMSSSPEVAARAVVSHYQRLTWASSRPAVLAG